MKISLVQTKLFWEDPARNRKHLHELIASISDSDLIVLPEMFTSGFTMNPENVAEEMSGETVSWMKSIAIEKNCAIAGSVVISENGNFYNRLIFATPSEIYSYDKRHLFTLAGENNVYQKGNHRLIIEYNGWKICPLVCYDLRFPVFSRNTEDYDLLIYVANWPEPRISAWDTLLKARAIENMCYVIGVNRIGEDVNGHKYPGHSKVIDCFGKENTNAASGDGVFSGEIDRSELMAARNKFAFLRDRDDFTVK